MSKNKHLLVLMILLVLFTAWAAPPASEAAGKLTDLREAAWAEQAITEMHASDIITGYPNGVFKPYNNVTRLEALAMLIRVLGLEEQARALDKAKVDYKMPANLNWGRGYLIMGVQLGMLNKDYLHLLQPDQPASRVEVTVLVYHALKLSPDSSALTFADSDQIPREYRECVAAIVQKNIMQGLPGNVFKPNDNINRAQMAVLVARLVDNKFANPYPERRYTGKLSLLDKTSRVLTVQLESRVSLSKVFTADCEAFLDGARVDPGTLAAGDEVKLVLNKNDQVVFIKAQRVAAAGQKFKGRLDNLFAISGETWLAVTDLSGNKITRPVAANLNTQSLTAGSFVEINVVNNKITQLTVLETTTLKGTVTSISQSALSVRQSGGTQKELSVPGNVEVLLNNVRMSYSAVKKYDLVEVTVSGNEAISIKIILSGLLEGKIVELDTTGTYGITIENDNGNQLDYVVLTDVTVEKNGREIDFDELRKGNRVRLELDSIDRVTFIQVIGVNNLEGEIVELDTTGTYGLIIENDEGDEMDYVVSGSVEVEKDGDEIDFEDLREGDRVRLELDARSRVTFIEVIESGSPEGEIVELYTSGTYGITIKDDNGKEKEYVVVSSVEVEKNGREIDFEDLREGDQVRLELNSRDRVVHIKVLLDAASIKAGKVIELTSESSNPMIRIENSEGRKLQYYISSRATYLRDDENINLTDIVIGCEVEIRLESGKAKRINVTNDENITLEGEVVSVSTSRNRITIEQINGNRFTYNLASNVTLKDRSGKTIDLEDVVAGWDVELVLKNGNIYKLTRL